MMNFHVEKKVPTFFIDWNSSVSKTKLQKLEWLFFLDKKMMSDLSDDVVFCRKTSVLSDDVVFVGRRIHQGVNFLSKKPSGFSFD